jgi:hypothetical protein
VSPLAVFLDPDGPQVVTDDVEMMRLIWDHLHRLERDGGTPRP